MNDPDEGIMLDVLKENESTAQILNGAKGKRIASLKLRRADVGANKFFWEDALHFTFTDGEEIRLSDRGQDCCELRYITTDDDLDAFVGADFVGVEVRPVEEMEAAEVHEVLFLLVHTSLGTFTMETHNEHNGYYGGFNIQVQRRVA